MQLTTNEMELTSCAVPGLLMSSQTTSSRFDRGGIYRHPSDTVVTHALGHEHDSVFDRRVQEASKSSVECTFTP